MKKTIDELKRCILSTTKETRRKFISALAIDFEYYTLEIENIPSELFDLYTDIFSSSVFCEKSGTDEFVRGLFNDFYKLSVEQKIILLESFISNSGKFSDSTLRWAIGDMIARNYSLGDALNAFHRMWLSGRKNSQIIAQFGVDVLSLELPKKGPERDELRKFSFELLQKKT